MTSLTVTELHTQDGWDWPNGRGDEQWPREAAPVAENHLRDMLEGAELLLAFPPPRWWDSLPPPLPAPRVVPKPRQLTLSRPKCSTCNDMRAIADSTTHHSVPCPTCRPPLM